MFSSCSCRSIVSDVNALTKKEKKGKEHCFNISRDIVFSVFYRFMLQTI